MLYTEHLLHMPNSVFITGSVSDFQYKLITWISEYLGTACSSERYPRRWPKGRPRKD